jgi:hypothetical protein
MAESPADRLRATLTRLDRVLPPPASEPELSTTSIEELERIACDPTETPALRRRALARLAMLLRAQPELSVILHALLGDPDELVVREAIRSSAPFDGSLRHRLLALLDDPREPVWSEAASVLARRMDPAVAPRLLAWFRGDDPARRRAAAAGLACVLKPESTIELFQPELDRGGRDPEDCEALAAALSEARRRADGRRKVFGGDDEDAE